MVVVTAVATLPFPPVAAAGIEFWNNAELGTVPNFDIEYALDATATVKDTELLGGIPETQAIADDAVDTVDFANDELDLTAHAYEEGDGPLQLTTTDTLPTGLDLATDYWIHVVGVNTIQLATSRDNALNGVFVSFSDVGVGTHTIVDTADTKRLSWVSHGLLGPAGDGDVDLQANKGFAQRVAHRPRVVAYAITSSAPGANISISIYGVLELG